MGHRAGHAGAVHALQVGQRVEFVQTGFCTGLTAERDPDEDRTILRRGGCLQA